MSVENSIAALGAMLTAVFTGVLMWLDIQRSNVSLVSLPDGGVLVTNNAQHTVVVQNVIAKGGTLSHNEVDTKGRAHKTDSGRTHILINKLIAPNEEELLWHNIYVNGKPHISIGTTRRVHWLRADQVNIILRPGAPVIQKTA